MLTAIATGIAINLGTAAASYVAQKASGFLSSKLGGGGGGGVRRGILKNKYNIPKTQF